MREDSKVMGNLLAPRSGSQLATRDAQLTKAAKAKQAQWLAAAGDSLCS